MKKALAGALAALLAVAALSIWRASESAERQRVLEARADSAVSAAREAARASKRAWAARDSAEAERDSLKAAYADSMALHREASAVSRAAAREEARRLRDSLTASQREQFDQVVVYYETALQEERAATDDVLQQLKLAELQAADNLALALTQREEADRWRSAYEAEHALRREIERPDLSLLGIEIRVGCVAGAGVTYDAIPRDRHDDGRTRERRLSAGPSVTCGAHI